MEDTTEWTRTIGQGRVQKGTNLTPKLLKAPAPAPAPPAAANPQGNVGGLRMMGGLFCGVIKKVEVVEDPVFIAIDTGCKPSETRASEDFKTDSHLN